MREIPLEAIPYQTLSFMLEDKSVQVSVRQLGTSLYTSLWIDGEPITSLVRATNGGRICAYPTSAIDTDLRWIDTVGDSDPQYDGLGTRWRMVYGN